MCTQEYIKNPEYCNLINEEGLNHFLDLMLSTSSLVRLAYFCILDNVISCDKHWCL